MTKTKNEGLLQSTALDWQRKERRNGMIQKVLRAGEETCFIQRMASMLDASTRKGWIDLLQD